MHPVHPYTQMLVASVPKPGRVWEPSPIPPADPIEAVKFRMDQQRLQPSDLLSVFGTRGRASEILQRKRHMSLNVIRALSSKEGR